MRKLIFSSSLILAFFVSGIPASRAALVYRSGEGWVSETEDAGAAETSASAQLHKAEALETAGDLKKAISAYRTVLRKFPDSGAGPKAQLKIAQLYEATGDPEKAFDAYGNYIIHYPRGEDFEKCVEGQFNIAKAFLSGERRKLFGFKTFPSMERAQQMFEAIIKNAPYSKYAALSQFNVGQANEKQGKDPEAITAYQQVVDKYPADEIAADAQYQIGYIYLKETNNGSNDQATRTKSREAFEDFMMHFPQSEKIPQAKDNISKLAGTDINRSLGVAQFYERTGNFKAAVVYYGDVVNAAPDSPEASIAQKQISHLKETVGESALRAGPERAETGAKAEEHRKLQAHVETTARPDYVGPPAPVVPDETPPAKPELRPANASVKSGTTAPGEPLRLGPPPPAPEPALPGQ